MTNKTTDTTTSHLANPASEKLLDGHPKDAGQLIGYRAPLIIHRSHALRGNGFTPLCGDYIINTRSITRDAERLKPRSHAEHGNDKKNEFLEVPYSHSTRLPKYSNQVAGYKSKLLAVLIASLFFCSPASAKMYKWVDDKGTTHYGETIPPEYAHKDRAELNKAGRVIKKEDVLTPEERLAKEQANTKKRDDENTAIEQKRRDKALINTYSNVNEIDLARSRNLQQVDARINSINSQLKMANNNWLSLQKEIDGFTKANKKVPASLQEDLQESQARLTKLQQDLGKTKIEKAALEARYDADKVRYKELTGK